MLKNISLFLSSAISSFKTNENVSVTFHSKPHLSFLYIIDESYFIENIAVIGLIELFLRPSNNKKYFCKDVSFIVFI